MNKSNISRTLGAVEEACVPIIIHRCIVCVYVVHRSQYTQFSIGQQWKYYRRDVSMFVAEGGNPSHKIKNMPNTHNKCTKHLFRTEHLKEYKITVGKMHWSTFASFFL